MTDAYFVYPAGSSVSAYEIAERFKKPILLKGLGVVRQTDPPIGTDQASDRQRRERRPQQNAAPARRRTRRFRGGDCGGRMWGAVLFVHGDGKLARP